jgi:hypothetical protein
MSTYEHKPFRDFLKDLQWKQGEHWFTAAPTQTGKTTITASLVSRRAYVVVLGSKPKDPNLRNRYADYKRISEWPPPRGERRVLLWPKWEAKLADTIDTQRRVFKDCLDGVGRTGGWCVVVDEFHWLSQFLRLDKEDAILQHQGSTSGITMVNLSQRPAWIPRITYSSATHALIGATTDKDDLKALSNFGGADSKRVIETVQTMGRHDLLYLNPMGTATPCVINGRK